MIEDEALVWYEADGTRHVLGEPRPEPVRAVPRGSDAPAVEPAAPWVEPPVPEPAEPKAPAQPETSRQPEPELATPPRAEPTASGDDSEAPAAETVEEPADEEPSALRGMVRALLLGAAAAAATGAAVGAISLAATGDRPDTSDETIVPSTLVAEEDSVGAEPSATTVVERIDLAPPTTSGDQPG